jgi:hypothetical protein
MKRGHSVTADVNQRQVEFSTLEIIRIPGTGGMHGRHGYLHRRASSGLRFRNSSGSWNRDAGQAYDDAGGQYGEKY